jgi:beta-lactamase class A/beta-lactamase class A VEB
MIRHLKLATLLLFITAQLTIAQSTDSLRSRIQQIVSDKSAIVGVCITGNDGKDTISLNGELHYPMQSVFKFHIALAVMAQIDKGKLSLDQKVEVQKKELLPDLWSPLREENPEGGSFSISKLLEYTVSLSDNVGCDVLLRLVGGTKAVEDYIRDNNIKDVSIKVNEEQQQAEWSVQFQNWTTPKASNEVLSTFYFNKKRQLSNESYDFIWSIMKKTKTGANRLKGQLPAGTIIAHKTGSSGANSEGLTAAVNDIGIVFLPNGNYFLISVFVTNSKENEETNEKIISDIAKATWDHYMNQLK